MMIKTRTHIPIIFTVIALIAISALGVTFYTLFSAFTWPIEHSETVQYEKFSSKWWEYNRPVSMQIKSELGVLQRAKYLEVRFPLKLALRNGYDLTCCTNFQFLPFKTQNQRKAYRVLFGYHMPNAKFNHASNRDDILLGRYLRSLKKLLHELPVTVEIWYLRTNRLRTDENVVTRRFLSACSLELNNIINPQETNIKPCFDRLLMPSSMDFWKIKNPLKRQWDLPWISIIDPKGNIRLSATATGITATVYSTEQALQQNRRTPLGIRQAMRQILKEDGINNIAHYPSYFNEKPEVISFFKWIDTKMDDFMYE